MKGSVGFLASAAATGWSAISSDPDGSQCDEVADNAR